MAYLAPLACASLGAVSVLMCAAHVNAWQRHQQASLDEHEHAFHRRQYFRRMQTSAMLGVLAVAMGLGLAISAQTRPLLFLSTWSLAAGLAIWILLLAAGDMVVTHRHYAWLARRELKRSRHEQSSSVHGNRPHQSDVVPPAE